MITIPGFGWAYASFRLAMLASTTRMPTQSKTKTLSLPESRVYYYDNGWINFGLAR